MLPQETRLEIEAEGSPESNEHAALAQGWILDLDTRQPVWTQRDARGRRDRRSDNWQVEDEITLPAGTYGVYFGAFSGHRPVNKKLKVFGLELGSFDLSVGPKRDWDEEGDPDSWGIWVYAASAGVERGAVPAEVPPPFPEAIVRYLGLGDGEHHEVRIDLDKDVEFKLWATGEHGGSGKKNFADTAWIVDLKDWSRVWELSTDDTESYGGARKNRVFDGRLRMPAGSYLVSVATDPSHAYGSWNDLPPWDPDSWGLALSLVDSDDRSSVHVDRETARPEPQVEIRRVRSGEFIQKPFVVDQEVKVLVRALGERPRGDKEFADFGWIERQDTFEAVWRMEDGPVAPAGGGSKNRLVEDLVMLEPGGYALCYLTDDSHAYGDWNTDPPFDPSSWGVSIATVDAVAGSAISEGTTESETAVISLAPVRDGEHVVKRFQTVESTRVRIFALGEGQDGDMYDYGWLEESETGEEIWAMTYSETRRAGGARKNREETVVLDLPPGTYELHYRTDGNHSFGDWNASPPRQPHLWGLTLVELP